MFEALNDRAHSQVSTIKVSKMIPTFYFTLTFSYLHNSVYVLIIFFLRENSKSLRIKLHKIFNLTIYFTSSNHRIKRNNCLQHCYGLKIIRIIERFLEVIL